jgi:hypothetical protein
MKRRESRAATFIIIVIVFCAVLIASPAAYSAQTGQINALYLLTLPSSYETLEKLAAGYKESGANTLIIKPMSSTGSIDKRLLSNTVFLAHSAGMKVFVVAPTRELAVALEKNAAWEDMRYDLSSGTAQPTGRLDLFNPYATVYLTDFFRDIASYSVDAILLDEDFYYGDTEGMTGKAMERYKQKYGTVFNSASAFWKLKPLIAGNQNIEEYGEEFWNFAEIKKNILILLLNNIIQASKAANKDIRIAVPLHVPRVLLTEKELLAWYSYQMSSFKKIGVSFFWIPIFHRNIREQQDLTYKKTIEAVSRIVTASRTLADPARVLFGIQTVLNSGSMLPLSEIEDVADQAKKAGTPDIAFMLRADTELPAELTRKTFKRQPE